MASLSPRLRMCSAGRMMLFSSNKYCGKKERLSKDQKEMKTKEEGYNEYRGQIKKSVSFFLSQKCHTHFSFLKMFNVIFTLRHLFFIDFYLALRDLTFLYQPLEHVD